MRFYPFEVSETHIVYACLGGFVVLFSMFTTLAKEKLYVGEVVFATLFGIIIGPSGANVFKPRDWGSTSDKVTNEITLEVTRIVLALGVFAIGVELPKSYMARHWKSLILTVVPVMFFGYVSSAGLLVAIFPKLTYLSALIISACLTPTDPILASAIVGGHYADKNVPGHIRRLLAAESAANDGLAYPFLFLPIYLSLDSSTGTAMKDFVTISILWSVVLGVIVGAVLGYAFGKFMRLMERKGFIGPESYVVQFVALAVFIEGIVTLMGSDDLLACFAAGSAISWDGHFNEQTEDNAVFATLVDSIMNCVVFVFIGAWIRFPDWTNAAVDLSASRLVGFFFSILFIRRIPALMLLYKTVPDIHNWREALFCGWFGPMGVGAVYISTLALTYLPQPHDPPQGQLEVLATVIQPVVSCTILGSILVHGLSIPAFSFVRSVNTTLTMSRSGTVANQGPEWINQTRRLPHHHQSLQGAGAMSPTASGNVTRSPSPLPSHSYPSSPALGASAAASRTDLAFAGNEREFGSLGKGKSPAPSIVPRDMATPPPGNEGGGGVEREKRSVAFATDPTDRTHTPQTAEG